MTEETETGTKMITESLRKLAQLVAEHGLSELTVEEAGVTLTVKASVEFSTSAPAVTMAVPAHPHLLTAAHSPAYSETPVLTPPKPKSSAIALESPMVGVFYQSPSPEDPAFVAVGDVVKVGQTIGLIEAMKVYSEVPSEVAGRVTEMPVESGKLVQQGQPLIFVEPQ
ncbi:MAG: acetyl-CoA carboxylase biotin carboxyl carrier protein [Janthinobacterium lividum]